MIAFRGNLQLPKNIGPPYIFHLSGHSFECILQHKFENAETGDDMIVVGYFAKDDYDDPMLYVCAYFNISKNQKSKIERKSKFILCGLFISNLAIVALNYTFNSNFLFVFMITTFTISAFVAFFCTLSLVAYGILENEILSL